MSDLEQIHTVRIRSEKYPNYLFIGIKAYNPLNIEVNRNYPNNLFFLKLYN